MNNSNLIPATRDHSNQEIANALANLAMDCEQPFFVDTLLKEAARRVRYAK